MNVFSLTQVKMSCSPKIVLTHKIKKSKKEHNSVIIYLCNVYDDEWIELIFCIESPKDK